ncbi:MAG TPA: hypothetical protein VME17_26325 [Bryobacteraceae bacterium]|nr:hypothetical protein [Bryobacteraceae bacterium]
MAQATNNAVKTEKKANRPVHTVRYGAVRAAIWRNVVDNGNADRPMYSVTFSRSYKDDDNNWKDSATFGPDDLLTLAKVANDAHTFVHQNRSKDSFERRKSSEE